MSDGTREALKEQRTFSVEKDLKIYDLMLSR
jgi:hypothetical protein